MDLITSSNDFRLPSWLITLKPDDKLKEENNLILPYKS